MPNTKNSKNPLILNENAKANIERLKIDKKRLLRSSSGHSHFFQVKKTNDVNKNV